VQGSSRVRDLTHNPGALSLLLPHTIVHPSALTTLRLVCPSQCIRHLDSAFDNMSLYSGIENTVWSGATVYGGNSRIRNAGYGLFTVRDVNDGEEIFRSEPVNCVDDGMKSRVCDYCYRCPESPILPNSRIRSARDATPKLKACSAFGDNRQSGTWALAKCIEWLLWILLALTRYLPDRLYPTRFLSYVEAQGSGCNVCYYCSK
jgi:hypothetical protein